MSKYTEQEIRQLIAEALNLYCFQNVWNERPSEFTVNIILNHIGTTTHTGNVFIHETPLALPTSGDAYYVYELSATVTHGINDLDIPYGTWISSVDMCNKYNVLLSTYHLTGKMFHKAYVYLYPLPSRKGHILAINKKMATSIVNHKDMLEDVRLTIYYDSDITDKMTVHSCKIPLVDNNNKVKNEVLKFIQKCSELDSQKHLTVYINGYERVLKDSKIFTNNSYVDVIHDENIQFSFEDPLWCSKCNNGFFSDRDKLAKTLVHIPKELNPDNDVLTHNTMTIHVRKVNKDKSLGEGLYLHRCAVRSVTQVTHNDIAIPNYILDAYRDYLGTQDISLQVVVRKHDKDNKLIRDKSYIDLLYTLDDETIISHLAGKESDKLSFWRASELEKSKYVEMMFDVPEIITEKNMFDYVEGLGYYQTIALLCTRMHHTKLTDSFQGSLLFNKPYLYQVSDVYPIAYLNGKKINNNYVNVNNDRSLQVGVSLDETKVSYTTGDILSVELYLDGSKNIYKITPTDGGETYVDVPFSVFDIIEGRTTTVPIETFGQSYTYMYKLLEETLGNVLIAPSPDKSGYTRITFGPSVYDKTFYIQNKFAVHRWEHYIDDTLESGAPIIYPLNWNVYHSSEKVPVYHTPRVLAYLNGKYLTEGLDYTVQDVLDYNGDLVDKILIVQNLEYLESSGGNYLEVFATGADVLDSIHGFIVDDHAFDPIELELLYENMSAVHVDGILEPDAKYKGVYIEIPENKYRQGAPFEVMTVIPSIMKDFIDLYHPNDDRERLEILSDYLYGKGPELPDTIILDHSHRVYSIFTAAVIRDIINDTADVSLDPDSDRFMNQLIKYYGYRDADLVYNNKIDLRFVDAYPHYKNYEIEDINKYTLVHSILRRLLPDDTNTNYTDVDIEDAPPSE